MKNIFLLLFTLCITAGKAWTQTTIEYMNGIPKDLTAAQLQDYYKYLRIEGSKEHQIIRFAPVATAQMNGILPVNLPRTTHLYHFKAGRVEYTNAREYVWEGSRMEGTLEYPDHLLLTMTNGLLAGEISVDNGFYRILPISDTYQILFKMEDGEVGCNALSKLTNGEDKEADSTPCTMNGNQCRINVMIAYTNDVHSAYPAIYPIARTLVEQINTAMRRSKIKHRWRLVDVVRIVDTWNDYDASGEWTQVNNLLATSSVLRTDRENAKADVVVVLSMGNLYGDVSGIAYLSPATPELACAAVKVSAAIGPRLTFTHELGHTLGAQHDNENCCLPARAHTFTSPAIGITYKSVLYSLGSIGQRILNYSNPEVSYVAAPTGEADRNNACVMQNNGCTIAQLIPAQNCFFVVNGLFDEACNSEFLFLSVSAGDNSPGVCNLKGLEYTFEYSLDGINFTSACSSPDPFCDISFSPSLPGYRTVFVRTTISDGSGILAVNFDWFSQTCPYAPIPTEYFLGRAPSAGTQNSAAGATLTLTPNVSTSDFYLHGVGVQNLQSVYVVDVLGKVIQQYDKVDLSAERLTISLGNAPAGTYFAIVADGKVPKTFRILKI